MAPFVVLGQDERMADNLTDFEESRLLDLSIPQGGGTYVALFTVAPADDGTGGTEVSGGSYARRPLTVGAAVTGLKSNNADILFPQATAAWGTIVAIAVFDALTAGNMRWRRTFLAGEQRSVNTSDQYRIASGALTFALS